MITVNTINFDKTVREIRAGWNHAPERLCTCLSECPQKEHERGKHGREDPACLLPGLENELQKAEAFYIIAIRTYESNPGGIVERC